MVLHLSTENERLRATAIFFCGFSMIAASTVVWHILSARRRGKKVGAILVLVGWMSLADIFWAVRFMVNDVHTVERGPLCTFFGIVGQTMGAVLVSTNFVIGVDVFLCERFPFTHSSARCLPRYLAWVAFVAVSTATWVGAVDCYGPAPDGTCWIELSAPHGRCTTVFETQNYITISYVVFCTLVMLQFIVKLLAPRVHCGGRDGSATVGCAGAGRQRLVNRMAVFTCTFLFIWMPFSVFLLAKPLRISDAAKDGLLRLTSLTIPLTGVFNWLVWRLPLRALSGGTRGRHGHGESCCRELVPAQRRLLLFCARCRRKSGGGRDDDGAADAGAVQLQLVEEVENPGLEAGGGEDKGAGDNNE